MLVIKHWINTGILQFVQLKVYKSHRPETFTQAGRTQVFLNSYRQISTEVRYRYLMLLHAREPVGLQALAKRSCKDACRRYRGRRHRCSLFITHFGRTGRSDVIFVESDCMFRVT